MRVDGEEQAVILASVPQSLESGHGGERIHSKAAIFRGDGQALDTEIAAFFPSIVVKDAVAVVFDYVVIELLAGKPADRIQ